MTCHISAASFGREKQGSPLVFLCQRSELKQAAEMNDCCSALIKFHIMNRGETETH